VDLGKSGKALGRRWRKLHEGVLGEMTLGLMVGAPTPMNMLDVQSIHDPAKWTNEAAAGWGGDRWELWGRGQRRVVLLGTLWDSPADAGQFAAALAGHEGVSCSVSGDRVAVVAGDAGKKTAPLLQRILETLARASD
jgi:hypothetical protein